jgi:hypothetical protein
MAPRSLQSRRSPIRRCRSMLALEMQDQRRSDTSVRLVGLTRHNPPLANPSSKSACCENTQKCRKSWRLCSQARTRVHHHPGGQDAWRQPAHALPGCSSRRREAARAFVGTEPEPSRDGVPHPRRTPTSCRSGAMQSGRLATSATATGGPRGRYRGEDGCTEQEHGGRLNVRQAALQERRGDLDA